MWNIHLLFSNEVDCLTVFFTLLLVHQYFFQWSFSTRIVCVRIEANGLVVSNIIHRHIVRYQQIMPDNVINSEDHGQDVIGSVSHWIHDKRNMWANTATIFKSCNLCLALIYWFTIDQNQSIWSNIQCSSLITKYKAKTG
jgi:hypothetical protein